MGDRILAGAGHISTGLEVYSSALDDLGANAAGGAIKAINKPLELSLAAQKVEDAYQENGAGDAAIEAVAAAAKIAATARLIAAGWSLGSAAGFELGGSAGVFGGPQAGVTGAGIGYVAGGVLGAGAALIGGDAAIDWLKDQVKRLGGPEVSPEDTKAIDDYLRDAIRRDAETDPYGHEKFADAVERVNDALKKYTPKQVADAIRSNVSVVR